MAHRSGEAPGLSRELNLVDYVYLRTWGRTRAQCAAQLDLSRECIDRYEKALGQDPVLRARLEHEARFGVLPEDDPALRADPEENIYLLDSCQLAS